MTDYDNGINGATGDYLFPIGTDKQIATQAKAIVTGISITDPHRGELDDRAALRDQSKAPAAWVDPTDLATAGWGVIFAQTYDAALEISADNWNSLLWNGSLHAATDAKLVKALLTASQKALGADVNNAGYRDTLGVAKVLAGGKRNWNSAIQDFEFYIASSNQLDKEQRQRWIAALKAGQDPLTADEIKTLFSQ